jgi:hypothetical protein
MNFNEEILCVILSNIFKYSRFLNYKIPDVKKDRSDGTVKALKTHCYHLVNTLLYLYSDYIGTFVSCKDFMHGNLEENYWYQIMSPGEPDHYWVIAVSGNISYRFEAFWGNCAPKVNITARSACNAGCYEECIIKKYTMTSFNENRAFEISCLAESLLNNNIIPDNVKDFMRETCTPSDFIRRLFMMGRVKNNSGSYVVPSRK